MQKTVENQRNMQLPANNAFFPQPQQHSDLRQLVQDLVAIRGA